MLMLLKNDLKRTYKFFLTIFAIIIGISILFPFIFFPTNVIEDHMLQFMLGFFIISIVCITLSVLFLRATVQILLESFYKKEGYLTFTLPLTSKQLLFSKILAVTIWALSFLIISCLSSIIVGMEIQLLSKGSLDFFEFFKEMFFAPDIITGELPVLQIINSCLGFFVIIIIISFVGSLSNSTLMKKKSPIRDTFLFAGLIIIFSIVTSVSLRITVALSSYLFKQIFDLCFQLFIIIGGFFASAYLMEYRLEIE